MELAPPKGLARRARRSGRARSTPRGSSVVDVNDNPMERGAYERPLTSATLQREVGDRDIPHESRRVTDRDGPRGDRSARTPREFANVLAVTGDPPHVGASRLAGVYEVDRIGLVQLLSALNRGEDYVGKGSTPRRRSTSASR